MQQRSRKQRRQLTRRIEQEKTKAEHAATKAREIAEKKEMKRMEAEINKKTRAESQRIIAEVRKKIVFTFSFCTTYHKSLYLQLFCTL